ncbi:Inositol polyphosphate multikinase [Psilocybe cubensis]|uniref:Inositol polyphosphate multikinase n=2 Tax=Psilocybe cubensis TaxID=181762 RepID=A0ACB8H768_PSICU|nr:Inositol polyphosphate multikinase [Psilocybe cubensis]KAH9483532.1 Inositol polyphosphate multikinase [Psilocybe cubensis]
MSDLTNTQALATQVGGHAGVTTTEDGSLLIKPALPRELEFYQKLQGDSALDELRAFIPNFIGTLRLEGQVDPAHPDLAEGIVLQQTAATDQKDMSLFLFLSMSFVNSIVLENLSYPFLKPNILDIKLGTILYDETADEEKVARMIKTARETTSLETGVRLTGFQVYDNVTSLPVNTPKSYGKSIRADQLGEGIAKFFPVGTPVPTDAAAVPAPSSGLPRETLVPILRAIRDEVALVREVFSEIEMRMVGGSLLVIYEADWARAEEGIKRYLADDDEEEEEEEEADDEENASKRPGPPFVVKLIDFAHTRFVPGQGPDEGVLLGMDTVLKLLDARLKDIEAS